jgi:aspartate--ammonia ligase
MSPGTDKERDLAGPGVSTYEEVARILPRDYSPLLDRRTTMRALFDVKRLIEEGLARELNLMMVQVPLIVDAQSGVNDMLDRDGSRTPIEFDCGLGLSEPIRASVVQAATKWKRMALRQFGCAVDEGINTDMRAVRKDYFLDHDHSAYVDQWDWEKVIAAEQRTLTVLKDTVQRIWKVLKAAEDHVLSQYPALDDPRYPRLPDEIVFIHAEEILERFPDLPRKQREARILQEHPAVFIVGIGWPLADGYPHEMRAADYDDWITDTSAETGKETHGLNGDILVFNPVTGRRHELSSMGIRVTGETLQRQLEISGQSHLLEQRYHQAILSDEIPLSIGGGIGQSRTFMLLLRKAHLGEVSVSVWPEELKRICAEQNIEVLE